MATIGPGPSDPNYHPGKVPDRQFIEQYIQSHLPQWADDPSIQWAVDQIEKSSGNTQWTAWRSFMADMATAEQQANTPPTAGGLQPKLLSTDQVAVNLNFNIQKLQGQQPQQQTTTPQQSVVQPANAAPGSAMSTITQGYDPSLEQQGKNTAASPRMVQILAEMYGVDPEQMAQTIQHMSDTMQVRVRNLDTGAALSWSQGTVGATGVTAGGQQAISPGWYVSGLIPKPQGANISSNQSSNYSQIMYALFHGADSAKLLAGLEVMKYAEANGITDPSTLSDFRALVEQRVQQALQSPTERNDVLASLSSLKMDAANVSSSISSGTTPAVNMPAWLSDIETQYKAQHPPMSSQISNALSSIQSITGTQFTPSQDQLKLMAGWSSEQINEWTNDQPDPQHPGFTYGQWQKNYNTIVQEWGTNFGFNNSPSDKQVASLLGMTADQRTAWYDAAPMPGMNGMSHGTYKGYSSLISSVRDDLPASMGQDFVSGLASQVKK